MTSLIYRIQKDIIEMSLFTKEKQTHKLREKTSDCQGVKKRGKKI